MKPNSPKVRSVGAALIGALTFQSLIAQTAPATDESIMTLETFVTTGSNIKRIDEEKVLPITVFSSEQIKARDVATPVDLLTGIPEVTNVPANETAVNAVAARGDNANVALRGLTAANTLVLLNGRRMPFHPFNTSSVNVNTLPTLGIQQIEVLRDGASAVYGSDAVAGVINFVTNKAPDGTEITLRYGLPEHGGGMNVQGGIKLGGTFAGGKGTWVTNVSGFNRDAIYLYERASSRSADKLAFARPPFNKVGSAYDGLTATSQWPSFKIGSQTAISWFYPLNGVPSLAGTAALPRAYYADYNQYTTSQPMSARGNIYTRAEYELTPTIKAFGEVTAYGAKSQTARQPVTLSGSDRVVTLSADNPYNPYGSRFFSPAGTPNADGTARIIGPAQTITINSVLLTDGGVEKVTTTDQMYRLLGGLSGKIGSSSWTWETAAMLGGVAATDFTTNGVRDSKLIAAAARTDATAWNPFGYTFKVVNGQVVADQPYTNPASVRNGYTMSANRFGHSRLASGDAKIGGEVVELWAGPISASAGIEWRYEMKEDHKDPYVGLNPADSGLDLNDNDILVTSPKANYHGSRTIASAFAETVVPLVAAKNNIPLVNSLEADISVRHERYSDFGGTTKPKFGLDYKPIPSVMIRTSINKGFRAPDLADMYQPPAFSVASPPGARDAVRNNLFLSANQAPDAFVLSKTYTISNPQLKPENSTGKSAGIAVDVPHVKGLSFTVDYWEIEQVNLILSKGRDAALDEQLIRAYTQAQLAQGKNISDIDVGFHTTPDTASTYVGDVNTLRAPVTAQDRTLFAAANALLPASQQMAPVGVLLGGVTKTINSAGRNFTNGFDFSLTYSLRKTPVGQFLFTTEWSTFLNKFTKQTVTAQKDDDIINMILPKWKSSATVQWRNGPWAATINGTYISQVRTGANTNIVDYTNLGMPSYIKEYYNNGALNFYEIGKDQVYFNVGVSYRFDHKYNPYIRDTLLRFGVNNVFDQQPGLTATAAGFSAPVAGSLFVGREFTFAITRSF